MTGTGWIRRYRHPQLLVALSLLLFVSPFLGQHRGGFVVDVFLTLTLIAAVVACSTHRWQFVLGIGLTVLTTTASAYVNYSGDDTFGLAHMLTTLGFLVFITYLVMRNVFGPGPVDVDKICGALSGYLFMGMSWAFAYALLEWANPGSLQGIEGVGSSFRTYDRFIGYSFVTLTTVGYGNVVPANPRAEALASAEAIFGQIYLTVLVARLVALSVQHQEEKGVE
jgi:hypothetical protein